MLTCLVNAPAHLNGFGDDFTIYYFGDDEVYAVLSISSCEIVYMCSDLSELDDAWAFYCDYGFFPASTADPDWEVIE